MRPLIIITISLVASLMLASCSDDPIETNRVVLTQADVDQTKTVAVYFEQEQKPFVIYTVVEETETKAANMCSDSIPKDMLQAFLKST